MYYQKQNNEMGAYVSHDGARVTLMAADGVSPSSRKYWTWFDTLEACLAAWGLTYDPLSEQEPQPEEN